MSTTYSKLRGLIVEKFRTMENFSEKVGVTPQTVSFKLNNKVSFSSNDIKLWAEVLEIPISDIGTYFFT